MFSFMLKTYLASKKVLKPNKYRFGDSYLYLKSNFHNVFYFNSKKKVKYHNFGLDFCININIFIHSVKRT